MMTLVNIMRANAASCILFGLVFLLMPADVVAFLDTQAAIPTFVLIILGIGLIINGLDLIRVSRKPVISPAQVMYFAVGDFIWVLASIGLVLTNIWVTTRQGITSTLLVAVMVGIFGFLQMQKRTEKSPQV